MGKASEVIVDGNTHQTKLDFDQLAPFTATLPFPERFAKLKKEEDKEILKTFIHVEVNIPLLDAIKYIP